MSAPADFQGWIERYADATVDRAGVGAAMAQVRAHLDAADNLGGTSDPRDFYWLIDQAAAALREAAPATRCRAGCSECCQLHRALIRVYAEEWAAIRSYLAPRPELARRLQTNWQLQRDRHAASLARLQAQLDAGQRPRPAAEALPLACPLLDEGRCGVYPARPALCRAYGHFELTRADGLTDVFACAVQQQAVRDSGPVRARWPSFNPIYQAIADHCEGQHKRLIPLWLDEAPVFELRP